jgi:flagellum-specific ATP synthase
VNQPLDVGVKAINGLLTIGKGQRVGLMAGSGVGKSVLLGMITRQTKADIVVVGLIGERGREVKSLSIIHWARKGWQNLSSSRLRRMSRR